MSNAVIITMTSMITGTLKCVLMFRIAINSVSGNKQCSDLNLLSGTQSGKRLQGHTFLILQGVDGIQTCAQACLSRKRCQSFNLEPSNNNGRCELNLNTSIATGEVSDNPKFVYVDISNWPQIGSCANHDCSYDQQCVSSLTPVCRNCSQAAQCGVCSPIREVQNRSFDSYGCFKSTPLVLSNLLGDFQSEYDFNNVEATIIQCANVAANTTYDFFGIENDALCYAGNSSEARFEYPTEIAQCQNKCKTGVAGEGFMYVYQWL